MPGDDGSRLHSHRASFRGGDLHDPLADASTAFKAFVVAYRGDPRVAASRELSPPHVFGIGETSSC
jgi:hypothetical protein